MSKELAQALRVAPYQLELWANLTALFSARALQIHDEIEQFSAEVGRIVGERLAVGDKALIPWLTKAEEVQSDWLREYNTALRRNKSVNDLPPPQMPTLIGSPPTPSRKPPPTRHAAVMAGLNIYEAETRKLWKALKKKPVAPTVAELLAFINPQRESQGLPPLCKADVSEACQAVPSLKARFANARRGRPKKA